MSEDKSEPVKDNQNGVDGVFKTGDPSESDPCIEEKTGRGKLWWNNTERRLREKSGLSRRWLYYVGGLIVLVFVLVIVVITLGACWPILPHYLQFPVCKTAACLRASAQITQYMNQSAPKCNDILNYSCGSWFSQHALPPDRSKWNQMEQLKHQEAIRIRELVTTLPLPLHSDTAEWKLKHLYEACVEVENANADGARPLTTMITQLGGWHILRDFHIEEFDYKKKLHQLHVKYGVSPYFKISVIPNPAAPGNSSIAILPSGLGLPDRAYYYMPKEDEPIIVAYKQLIRDVVINLNAPKTSAEKFGNDIFHYEKRIAEITPEKIELANPVNTYNPIKVSELALTTPTLPLQDILTALFPSAKINSDTEVIIMHPDYLSKVAQIISSTEKITLNGYLIWTLVRKYLPFLSSQYKSAVDGFNSELYGGKQPLQRWEFCTDLLRKFMPLAVSVKLEDQYQIDQMTKEKINETFVNLKTVTRRHLSKYSTIPDLYTHLNKKISNLKLQISLPEEVRGDSYLKNYYNELTILTADLFESYKYGIRFLQKQEERRLVESTAEMYLIDSAVNRPYYVQYVPSSNTIVIPSTLLTKPYFENEYPNSVIYGRLGVDLAKAIAESVLPYDSAWTTEMKLLSSFHLSVNESLRLVRYPMHCLSEFCIKNELADKEQVNLVALNIFKYLSALNIAHEGLHNALENKPHIHQPSLHFEDSAVFYITQIQNLCTFTTKQQELYDVLVNFELAENSLVKVAWAHDKLMAESLECDANESQCSDIF